jgi:hypothetical protein
VIQKQEEVRKNISTTSISSVSANAELSTSTGSISSSSLTEISKEDFFAGHGKDIKAKKPVPRPSTSFNLVGLEPEKLANLQTYDPAELAKKGSLIFHGINLKSFNAHDFHRLYGDYINCQNPTLYTNVAWWILVKFMRVRFIDSSFKSSDLW